MSDAIDKALQNLITSGLATSSELVGCSEAELLSLERDYRLTLPSAYRYFLSRLGKAAGSFFTGTDFLFPQLREFRKQAELLLRETNAPLQLAKRDFVFAVHQGYQFLFFTADGTPDPSVFHYEENDAEARWVAPSFTRWFEACVTDEIDAAAELRPK